MTIALRSLSRARGFTVIELLMAFVIMAIISAIALPSYFAYARKSYRAEAKAIVMETAAFMERYWTTNKTYVGATVSTISAVAPKASTGTAVRYNISFATGEPTATTYKIQAVPANAQASDACGTLTLSNTGAQTASGTGTCW